MPSTPKKKQGSNGAPPLLSTNLPQRGEDSSGILGFELRDIRKEIVNAKKRKCMYCKENSATIMCATCKQYFHLICGHTNICMFQFIGQFKSYCHACTPPDDEQMRVIKEKFTNESEIRCFICLLQMGRYNSTRWIYAKCCGTGYAHSKCVKSYALCAGYYLKCIWCKNPQFREDVKYQGVFVPDRDANWETERGAYRDLHRVNRRCDMETCYCPKGRHYINSNKWQVIMCKLCGTFGAHNPSCIPGFGNCKVKVDDFTCDTCSVIERTCLNETTIPFGNNDETTNDLINTTLYIHKEHTSFTPNLYEDNLNFSEDSQSSVETVLNSKIHNLKSTSIKENITPRCVIPILTQSETQTSMEIEKAAESQDKEQNVALVAEKDKMINEGAEMVKLEPIAEDDVDMESLSEIEEDLIVDRLVQRILDLFE